MRITHVITRLIVGGAQENTIASVLGLNRNYPVQARLISGPTAGPEGSLEHQLAGSPALLTIVPTLVRPIHPWKDLLAFRELTFRFRQDQPHIIHTHSGKAGILGRLAAKKAGVRIIVHSVHGPSFGRFQGAAANALFRAAERSAGRVTTHFVTVATAMTEQYLAAGIGSPEQYTRIFSGFDLEPFLEARHDPELRVRYGIDPGDFVIGKIARLFELKGHDDLLTAGPEIVRRCPTAKFLLVGNGAWRTRLEQRARSLGLERHVIFTGLVAPEAVPRLIGIMDVLVHLSLREGLARALPQALAAAKPVLAYDCDGAREVCLHQQTGFLIPVGNLEALTERLLYLAHNPASREQMGQRGQTLVQERFSVEKMVDDLYGLYSRLLRVAV